MDFNARALELHANYRGKIEVVSKIGIKDREDLSIVYTPGVAEPCRQIHAHREEVYRYTAKSNLVAVVTDGSAVLGLGNIGPEAAMPVMEGKAILFKEFAGIDAFPICLATQEVEEIVKTVKYLAPTFGGINLEDISAPRCFEIEKRLMEEIDIPVFHDDQHGTAVVTAAGLLNALKVVGKKLDEIRVVVNGPGAAGTAITKMLLSLGTGEILVCDEKGILWAGDERLNQQKRELAYLTNREGLKGTLRDALRGADVFIGVSAPEVVDKEMIKSMQKDAIVFAMANPIPEIMPHLAKEAGARIVATGRSDFPNQINNVLAFPGIFRGALDVRARVINEEMKIAAAYAIAGIIKEEELHEENIIPDAFDRRIVPAVAEAVGNAAIRTGVARL
ncbi:malate dehydrogenase (oxaloacetate-decarboxylating) [Thermosyntropha lipolytica DSM 11003]|uniref:Malate dehydrogenase (Oxaloacetate-decarboxylating) n=1 Tax=Thermosyntropha lipolytica DSM 11003 TaxID=1123382 RepID=A0A1M5LD90_9FIRM|nr:NADP-dependent malic enzyme [Thermosyntropha lipolytica]SHG63072.1 malate dehydrogenase (oxaloacetate-decarboxylating) [Thermosyntropha lipolytica DSM 11003]